MKKYFALCVDDDQGVLNQLAIQLEEAFQDFCEFEYAESAEEASELYQELVANGNRIWLIICDQVMPGMSGDAFLEKIYQIDRNVLKVLLTGQAGLQSTIRAINHAGLNYYLEKPWSKDDLLLIVERLKVQYLMTTMVSEVQRRFAASIDLNETLHTIFFDTLEILEAEGGAIFLTDDYADILSCKLSQGLSNLQGLTFSTHSGIVGQVARTKSVHLAQNIDLLDMYGRELNETNDVMIRSAISTPLMSKDQVLGVLQVMNKKSRNAFSQDDATLLQSLSTGAALAIQNAEYSQRLLQEERIRSELLIAHQIQQGILPAPFEPRPEIHFEAVNKSAKDVGGDFYDYFEIGEQFAFFIGDVCGKGVPAAIFMASSRSTLKSQALANPNPSHVLPLANQLITEDAQEGMFVTVFYGLYSPQTHILRFLNAGHTISLLFRPGTASCASLLNTNFPVGIFTSANFDEAQIQLEPGDKLILYTDGVNEAINTRREQFGVQRIVELVLEHGNRSPKELQNAIVAAVEVFSEGQEQHDDITVMIVQV
ncbi:Stage II sporulation E family protein [Candidatus Vecturithrix granuli]|uniref:Stage II sporulation E family protein n=1 Tax=Vecturithrix granuli TaxID=1499967 RepID=A0A0S6W5Q5_VECG1|nr:Stage II sporulation E family protein [Candidatus Vecturithrix granuli]